MGRMQNMPLSDVLLHLQLHHVGIVVPDVEQGRVFFRDVLRQEERTGVIHDPIQTAFVQFFGNAQTRHYLELVAPDGERSKLHNAATKGTALHHLCFSCDSPANTMAMLQDAGCLVIHDPVPAVAFGGRKIGWVMSPEGLLLELLERGDAGGL